MSRSDLEGRSLEGRDPEDRDLEDRELAARIAALPAPASTLDADDVLGRARAPRRRRGPALAGLAVAACALLAVGAVALSRDGTRDRGSPGITGPSVQLEAAAEGPEGVRALRARGRVARDERVVFRATVGRTGWLILTEDGRPLREPEQVGAGSHLPGGGAVLSWRPDDLADATGDVSHEYSAWLCPDPVISMACGKDAIALWWAAR